MTKRSLNVKKLNEFYKNDSYTEEIKQLVRESVSYYTHYSGGIKSPQKTIESLNKETFTMVLEDLKLLKGVKTEDLVTAEETENI